MSEGEKSVFVDDEWRAHRHMFNPSKYKEYELHVTRFLIGLGFLNNINFIADYKEKITPIDILDQGIIDKFHRKTTLVITRKDLGNQEKDLLEKNGFKLKSQWATLILDASKDIQIDKGNRSIIRKAEKSLTVSIIDDINDFKKYHQLFKDARKQEGMITAPFKQYLKVFGSRFYKVFVAKLDHEIVAGIGTISNENYMLQLNIARDKRFTYASDFLTYKILEHCKNNNIRWFDFAGVHPDPEENSKDYFIRNYKAKWGGEFYNEYIFKR